MSQPAEPLVLLSQSAAAPGTPPARGSAETWTRLHQGRGIYDRAGILLRAHADGGDGLAMLSFAASVASFQACVFKAPPKPPMPKPPVRATAPTRLATCRMAHRESSRLRLSRPICFDPIGIFSSPTLQFIVQIDDVIAGGQPDPAAIVD